jgi:hypothetical protein
MMKYELDHISDEIKWLAERGKAISLEAFRGMRLNSYEREFLVPYLTDELLISQVEYYTKNSERHSRATYDGQLQDVLVPELLKRLKRRVDKN